MIRTKLKLLKKLKIIELKPKPDRSGETNHPTEGNIVYLLYFLTKSRRSDSGRIFKCYRFQRSSPINNGHTHTYTYTHTRIVVGFLRNALMSLVVASVIHHGVLAPAKSDRIFLSIPVIQPRLRACGWTQSRLSLLANPSLGSGLLSLILHISCIWIHLNVLLGYHLLSAANRRRLLRIACSGGTDQEDDVSSSSGECFFSKILFSFF